jgi:hypothetical protein
MIRIGITGHRPNRLKVPETKLQARVRAILRTVLKAAEPPDMKGHPALEIISPLAEGCDRIVAREALALGQRLTAIIPFARKDYVKTFSAPDAALDFETLWKASAQRINLQGNPQRSTAAYLAVGDVTLARADVILTIWDGNPPAGRGGTPEILQNALDFGVPIIWVHAAKDVEARVLVSPAPGTNLQDVASSRRRVSFKTWARPQTIRNLQRR